jgi:hypothetical protein
LSKEPLNTQILEVLLCINVSILILFICLGTRRILNLFATVFGFFKNKSNFISLFLILS